MVPPDAAMPLRAPTLVEVERAEEGLAVTWEDGERSFYHHVWLRDCCYCEICGDAYSSKRFMVPCDFELSVQPDEVGLGDEAGLNIVWSDGHRSSYGAGWLRENRYDDESRSARRCEPKLWNAGLSGNLPSCEFSEIRVNDGARLEFYRNVIDYGFSVVRGGVAEAGALTHIAELAGDIGTAAYGQIFDLSPSSRVRTMGNTTRPVPPHTDEPFLYTPPGLLLLYCIRPADDGGDTVLVDGFHLAETMRKEDPEAFELLSKWGHSFVRRHPGTLDQQTRARTFAVDDEGYLTGVRLHSRSSAPLNLPVEVVPRYYAAYHKLTGMMMAEENQIRIHLGPGEGVLVDNHRILHARTNFTDPERFLQSCNVSRESFHQSYRLLAGELGCAEEARVALPAGAIW